MNENTSTNTQTAPKTFDIIDGNTLMAQEYEPLRFAVEKILPHGVFILAGSGKIGKSWLSLDLCVNVATGGKLWEFSSEQGDVLYLALEDNYPRLQDRLNKIKAASVDISRLKLTTASFGINSGLIEQAHNHLAAFPDTKLIVIDTLERIRDTEFDKNIYACDYRDMTLLREITGKHKLTLLLIHHTRKMSDSDPLNTLSGSMGLVGSVDGVFVLEKNTRTGQDAKLTIANRDTEGFCFKLRFEPEDCKWAFIENFDAQAEKKAEQSEKDERLFLLVDEFLKEEWSGTATELCNALKAIDPNAEIAPNTITKKLEDNSLFKENNIIVKRDRDSKNRAITITRKVYVQGMETRLVQKEFDILQYLMMNKGIVLSCEQILQRVWGKEYAVNDRGLLWNQVSRLRGKLQISPDLPDFIITERKCGYSFNPRKKVAQRI